MQDATPTQGPEATRAKNAVLILQHHSSIKLPASSFQNLTATLPRLEIGLNSLMQKEKTFSNRNKNRRSSVLYLRSLLPCLPASLPPSSPLAYPARPDAGRERSRRATRHCISNRNYYGLEIDLSCCKQNPLIFSNRNLLKHPRARSLFALAPTFVFVRPGPPAFRPAQPQAPSPRHSTSLLYSRAYSSQTIPMSDSYDVICIGAGPTGLACAVEAKREGMRPLVIDKGCLCNSLFHYPVNMTFFTTPERMEIGDLPMTIAGGKPTRVEALHYYRRAVEHYAIPVRQYEKVLRITGQDGAFVVHTQAASGATQEHRARKIILATGYYDRPNPLGVPGEDLPHVSHYFTESHPYWNQDVVVIGARNSAAEAALDLFRGGARVTLIHRGEGLGKSLKYWVKPDIENRISAGEIRARFRTCITRIESGHVMVKNGSHEEAVPASQVFAMTGYHPDFDFLEQQGIRLDPHTRRPECNPDSLESNVPGIYLAGVIVGGLNTSEIFIENGRFHGKQIISAMAGKGRLDATPPVAPPGE